MQFSNVHNGNRNDSKAVKLALVAGLHVVLGVCFIHGINSKKISLSILPEQVLVMLKPDPVVPPPPSEPPQPMPTLAPPDVVVPKVEVDVAPPPQPAQIQATTASDPAPPLPASGSTGTATDTPPTATVNRDAGKMYTAVLADARACALPDYPTHAARNGETGTTMLALLVGTDGRVTSSRVEHTSGSRELDRAAVNALSLCRFKPATENGVAQAAWAQLAYVWTLD